MLEAVERHWAQAGIAEHLHVERFRFATTPAGAEANGPGRVRFTVTGREADAAPCVPLLVVGEDAGVPMPSGCRMGICHSCVARLVRGRVRDLRTGRIHGEAGDLVQTCVSAAAGPVHLEL
jgi:ferredoxin